MNIGILTDSSANFPQEIQKESFIEIIPISIQFGNKVYTDRVDLDAKTFFKKLEETDTIPTTSMPSVASFKEKYKDMSKKYDSILSIHVSHELSGTLQAARNAARQLPEIDIHFLDSSSTSLGLGFLVLLAAKKARTSDSISEILNILQKAKENLTLYFTVNELKYMKEGGRIGKARALMGSILNINPIISISTSTGKVWPLSKKRGKKRTMNKMIEIGKEKLIDNEYAWIGFAHGARKKDMESFKNSFLSSIRDLNLNYKTFTSRINASLGCHVGPKVYAAFILTGKYLKPN